MLQRSGFKLVGLAAVGLLVGCGPTNMGGSVDPPTPVGPSTGSSGKFGGVGAPGLVDANTPLFGGTVTKSASRVYPISGGTLTVTRDGKTAVAADPDRGRVFLADLATKSVRAVVLDENDELGRVVEGESGIVYVVARRGGAILRIDVPTGNVQRFPVCNAPRGVAYDAAKGQIHVTCVSGLLVSLDAPTGAVARSIALKDKSLNSKDDLRDIVMVKDKLVITRFRSSELLTVDATGTVVNTQTPTPTNFSGRVGPSTLAFRAVTKPNGDVVVVHQSSSNTVLGTGLGAYYGGNCGGSVADTFVTEYSGGSITQNYSSPQTVPLGGATGPLDVAISPDGHRTAIVATGNSWALAGTPATGTATATSDAVAALTVQRPTLQVVDSTTATGAGGCWDTQAQTLSEPGEAVAVAFDGNGKYIVQYREPAKLILEDRTQLVRQILLSTESRADTGLSLFQVNSGGGIACASCHPEGGVDGHIWQFDKFGQRVTQPLQGRVSDRAPFHWSGDLAKWDNLIDEVMMKRMSMPLKPTAEQSQGLLAWLDTIPNVRPPDGLDAAKVESGRAIFEDTAVGCTACHSGAAYTDNKAHDVGTGGTFVAPTLVGVGSRAPLMHDGCAQTLAERLTNSQCGGGDTHGKTSQLSDMQRGDLITFLKSL